MDDKIIGSNYTLNGMLGNNNCVEIPIIQRDYAQGRVNAREIIEDFVKNLFDHLDSNKKIKLSFVYGTKRETATRTIYIPYDGQQRLTLIYLLTLYMAARSNDWNEVSKLARFRYYTRDYAMEFCGFLTMFNSKKVKTSDNVFKRISFGESNLSEQLKNDVEFFSAWENDPTVFSMLVVLNLIHSEFLERYKDLSTSDQMEKCKSFLTALLNGDVFFDWCPINASDNIYIKMNGRGKPLSAFDNFKNSLYTELGKLREKEIIKSGALSTKLLFLQKFEEKMEGPWTDVFWNLRERLAKGQTDQANNIAPFMMNFLFFAFELRYAEKTGAFYFGSRMPFSWIDEKNVISFLNIFKDCCNDNQSKYSITLDDYVWLSKFLDVFKYRYENGKLEESFLSLERAEYLNTEYGIFECIATDKNRTKYETRYILSAQQSIIAAMYFEYLINVSTFDTNGDICACDDSYRSQWLSLIGRIIKTAGHYKGRFDALQRDKHVFQGYIDAFIPTVFGKSKAGNLIEASSAFDANIFIKLKNTFDASHAYSQLREELYKYSLIHQNKDVWEAKIRTAEQNLTYFENQIYFLFKLSEDDNGNIEEDLFDKFYGLSKELFDSKGVKEELEYKFTAILLYFDDYRIYSDEGRGNAAALCGNKSDSYQWRHFFDILNDSKNPGDKRFKVIKQSFELILEKESIEKAYEYVSTQSTNDTWRNIIIKYPNILSEGNNHKIVYNYQDDGGWYLIRSSGVSKQVHANSLNDSVNLELYGIYRESGFSENTFECKNRQIVIEPNVFLAQEGINDYSCTGKTGKCDYQAMVTYLKNQYKKP